MGTKLMKQIIDRTVLLGCQMEQLFGKLEIHPNKWKIQVQHQTQKGVHLQAATNVQRTN